MLIHHPLIIYVYIPAQVLNAEMTKKIMNVKLNLKSVDI